MNTPREGFFLPDSEERQVLDAQDIRHLGDYGVGVSVTAEQIEQLLYWAREFLKAVEAKLDSETS